MDPTTTPKFMKAAQATSFGLPADVLTVSPSVLVPQAPPNDHVQIAVHACSLSPSEYRMLSGDVSLFKKPRSGHFPYIPGGDVAGVIVAVPSTETQFHIGDRVVATWDSHGEGGLAQFLNVNRAYVATLPNSLDFVHGAAVVDSSANAMLAAEDAAIAKGDKVLVLGGSGAVGMALIQFAKRRGAAVVVATSTDHKLVSSLGADAVVNYRTSKWWEAPDVLQHAPFDVMIDCAEGVSAWQRVKDLSLVKTRSEGGRFLAVVINEWNIVIKSPGQMICWFMPMLGRMISSCWNRSKVPSYKMLFPAQRGDSLQRLMKVVDEGQLKVVIDKNSPLPFTTDGVRTAFDTMIERRAHGKVVVKIRDD